MIKVICDRAMIVYLLLHWGVMSFIFAVLKAYEKFASVMGWRPPVIVYKFICVYRDKLSRHIQKISQG